MRLSLRLVLLLVVLLTLSTGGCGPRGDHTSFAGYWRATDDGSLLLVEPDGGEAYAVTGIVRAGQGEYGEAPVTGWLVTADRWLVESAVYDAAYRDETQIWGHEPSPEEVVRRLYSFEIDGDGMLQLSSPDSVSVSAFGRATGDRQALADELAEQSAARHEMFLNVVGGRLQEGLDFIAMGALDYADAHGGRLPSRAQVRPDTAFARHFVQDWPTLSLRVSDAPPLAPGPGLWGYAYERNDDGFTLAATSPELSDPPEVTFRFPARGSRAACDTATRTGVRLIAAALAAYAEENDGHYPPPDEVRPSRRLGMTVLFWPVEAASRTYLRPGSDPGSYTYRWLGDGTSFELVGHLSGGRRIDVSRGEGGTQLSLPRGEVKVVTRPEGALSKPDKAVCDGVDTVAAAVLRWARDNAGVLPYEAGIDELGPMVEHWPLNPYTQDLMAEGEDAGDFTYESLDDEGMGPATATITGHLQDGRVYIVRCLPPR